MHKDLLGREIKVGHRLAYGGRAGSHGYMAVGDVRKINDKTVTVRLVARSSYWSGTYRPDEEELTTVQKPERAVIVNV